MWLEPQKFFVMGHMTWPHPYQGQFVTCTFNLYIKFVVFAISSPITKMHKEMQNVEIKVV